MTREEEIKIVHGRGAHVVILGAGATLALTLRTPEKNGKKLPLMNNLIEVIGLNYIIKGLPKEYQRLRGNFEKLYVLLNSDKRFITERVEIENRVYEYFKELELPKEPTIYDYLILALRHNKDVIATFNWDPFLYQAYIRNGDYTPNPGILFLHGCVAIGYDNSDGSSGPAGWHSKKTLQLLEPTKLLYPVEHKDYNKEEYIKGQWESLSYMIKKAERVTIFGYSKPKTDIAAIELLKKSWGRVDEREMEEFEFIDIKKESKIVSDWRSFVHTHHYHYCNDYFDSSLALHPRRTVESYHHWAMPMTLNEAFQDGNLVPNDIKKIEELWNWHKPLIEAEQRFYSQ